MMKLFKRRCRPIPLLTSDFWWAVNDVKNHVLMQQRDHYFSLPPEEREGHVFESARLLQHWVNLYLFGGEIEREERSSTRTE